MTSIIFILYLVSGFLIAVLSFYMGKITAAFEIKSKLNIILREEIDKYLKVLEKTLEGKDGDP